MSRLGSNQMTRRVALVLAGLSLVGYLGYLLTDLYRSRQALQRLQQEQLFRESERRALALEYFFSERVGDLTSFGEDRVLRTFFENRALGMSMEYGLGASLYAIRQSFTGLQAQRRLGEAPIYKRLAFVEQGGAVLADVAMPPEGGAAGADVETLRPFLASSGPRPQFRPMGDHLVLSVPYQFRPGQGGHILAWFSTEEVLAHFVGREHQAAPVTALLWEGRPVESGARALQQLPAGLLAEGEKLHGGARSRIEPPGGGRAWLAIRNDVAGTPFSLLTLVPEGALGAAYPGTPLILVGALGLIILVGGMASLRAQRKALRGLEDLLEALPCAVVLVSQERKVELANGEARRMLSDGAGSLPGKPWSRFVGDGALRPGGGPQEAVIAGLGGTTRPVLLAEVPARFADEPFLIEAFVDLSEQKRLEAQLRQAQKLEAVGQLASGIAHEINTPIQFVGDNTVFFQEALAACFTVIDRQRAVIAAHAPPAVVAEVERTAEMADLPYIREEGPRAIERTLAGAQRVAAIVRAMREFAHPDQKAPRAVDLNRAVQSTLEIARSEYKYVADVEASYGEIPPVTCMGGEVNQVLLNLIVNAAHAVADAVDGTERRGVIRVSTGQEGDQVAIRISDTGVGIPAAIQHRIFEPFFTTKEVGRGTGQGLPLARSVVERHRGTIDFRSVEGEGTTFTIRLPIAGPDAMPAGADAMPAGAGSDP